MGVYILRRLLQTFPVLLGITLAVFLVFHYSPGDPAILLLGEGVSPELVELTRQRLGLDQPAPVQYWLFVQRLARGDLGTSYVTRMSVAERLAPAFRSTLRLALFGTLVTVLVGLPAGILAAKYRHGAVDSTVMALTTIGISAPVFWIGIILVYVFAFRLGWLPSGGVGGYGVVLPAVTLGLHFGSMLARMTRSCMLEVLGLDYIRTAHAKGLPDLTVFYKHALRNASLPIVTLFGLQIGNLLGGTVVTEMVFAWPGMGRLILRGIFERDAPTIQAAVILVALVFVGINLTIDVLYAVLNPTIRYS